MNPDTTYLTYTTPVDPYEEYSDSKIEMLPLSMLSKEQQASLLNVLNSFWDRKIIGDWLNQQGYFTPEQIKEVKGVVLTNQDSLYFGGNYFSDHAKIKEKLCEHQLKTLENAEHVFARVSIPADWKSQIEEYKKNKQKLAAQKEEQKKLRKIKKAEKLLKEAGKL
jgi:hypothetical protein